MRLPILPFAETYARAIKLFREPHQTLVKEQLEKRNVKFVLMGNYILISGEDIPKLPITEEGDPMLPVNDDGTDGYMCYRVHDFDIEFLKHLGEWHEE